METKSKCEACEYASGEHTCCPAKEHPNYCSASLPTEDSWEEKIYKVRSAAMGFQVSAITKKELLLRESELLESIRTQIKLAYEKGQKEARCHYYEKVSNEARTATIGEIREAVRKIFDNFRLADWSGESEVEQEIERLALLVLDTLE